MSPFSDRDLTRSLAESVLAAKPDRLDDEAIFRARDAFTDAIGVGLLGSLEPLAEKLLKVLKAEGGVGSTLLLGCASRGTQQSAALYNGSVIHALDYDDINHPAYSHPSSHLVPVMLSLGPMSSADGPEAVLAYVLGLEVEAKLGRVMNIGDGIPHLAGHYAAGWHTTATFGSIAATITAGRLLGLSTDELVHALGIAGSAASGLRANFGTMVKPLHAGMAAENGVRAVLLAREGFEASRDILGARFGFFDVLTNGAPRVDAIAKLGPPWEITTPYGIALKPYPSCGATHCAIEAAITLSKRVPWDRVSEVRVGVNEVTPSVLVYRRPANGLEAKFSMEYCVAAALYAGEFGPRSCDQAVVDDPNVRALMERIQVSVDDRVRTNPEHAAIVQIIDEGGGAVEHTVMIAKGKPERWMSTQELLSKFLDCTEPVIATDSARDAFALLQSLPDIRSFPSFLQDLAHTLSPPQTVP